MWNQALDNENRSNRPAGEDTGPRPERSAPSICAECGTPLERAWLAQRPSATLCPECTSLTDFAPPACTD
jgi:RNA polymerase-binding transcription factor DksA